MKTAYALKCARNTLGLFRSSFLVGPRRSDKVTFRKEVTNPIWKRAIGLLFLSLTSVANALQPTVVVSDLPDLPGPPLVMAVDGDFLYFRTSDGSSDLLYRIPKASANLTLATLPPPIVGEPSRGGGINDLAFDASNIFIHIGGYGNGYIWRLPKTLANGSFLVSTIGGAMMVGVIGSNMYFTHGNSGSISQIAKIDVSETNPTNFQDISNYSAYTFFRQKTLDANSIYLTDIYSGNNLARFDLSTNTEVWRVPIPSEGHLFSDNSSVYLSPGYTSFGVLKAPKQTGQVQTLVPGTNGALGHVVGGGFVYYVENSTLWAIPSGGGTPINLASPVDVHNAVYDNGTLY